MVVQPTKIKELEDIAELQKPVDSARNKVNALLRQKLSLDMTERELISLGISPDELQDVNDNIKEIMAEIVKTTGELSKAVIQSEKSIAKLKDEQGQKQISSAIQSPIDFTASQLKQLPLSSDSMNMDVQYFRYEDNEDSDSSTARSISTYVGMKVSSFLGGSAGVSAGASAHEAVNSARNNRKLVGTVVILINCTHKQAQVFAPLQLDVDSAIENYVMYSGKDWDGPNDPAKMLKKVDTKISVDAEKKGMPVLVGATYGSSFVGFVHFEQVEETQSYQSARSAAVQASASIERSLFLASIEGSSGMDAETATSVKHLMSTSSIQSHCNVITMGLIPSIKSNAVTTTVKKLQGGPKEHMEQLAAMQDASNNGMASMSSQAAQARKSQSIKAMDTNYIKSAVDAVAEVQNKDNKVIDMNSLMTALDDFIERANKGESGVPINFYLKYITESTIALQWMQKYYPDLLHEKINKEDGDEGGES
jgi:hypothetical protein